MSMNLNAPYFILIAAKRLYSRLPELVGVDWLTIQPQVDDYIETLTQQPNAYLESTQLVGLLARSESARLALADEMKVQEAVTNHLTESLAMMGAEIDDHSLAMLYAGMTWEVEADTLSSPDKGLPTRNVTLKDGGVGGGKSVKLRNLDIDLNKMMTIGAGFFMTGDSILDKPKPFVIAAGLLMMVGTLLTEMTVTIDQQEATVFWGFIVETNDRPKDRHATADAVFAMTNVERDKRGLPELTRQQFDHSLYKLEQLGSIIHTEGETYKIIEKFRIKE